MALASPPSSTICSTTALGPVEVDVADEDLGALGGEPEGRRPPHAGAAAGDEGYAGFESAHGWGGLLHLRASATAARPSVSLP